jgi:5-methyltetrahydrofolate--homocysteine methyltransferase
LAGATAAEFAAVPALTVAKPAGLAPAWQENDMIIIGEKINATRKAMGAAIVARDEQHILKVAREQIDAGANYLDLNGGDPKPGAEEANMEWLVNLVQGNFDVPLCLDSANPAAIEVGLKLAKHKPIVNSVSLEKERLEKFLPILAKNECLVVALCMADEGMPTGAEDRVARAAKLIEAIGSVGKTVDEIIIDPCFFPVSAEPKSAIQVCQAIAAIRANHPGVHAGGGLSNVSYGLPGRKYINLTMAAACVYSGMDAVIIDPCTHPIVPLMLAGEVLNGSDEWCANWVGLHRAGKLQ